MSETANHHEITNPVEKLSAEGLRSKLANEYGIDGDTPAERVQQIKNLSVEGIAILLEDINKSVQGSAESLVNHDSVMKIGEHETIALEDRYDVFAHMIKTIKNAPDDLNPGRVGDTLALGTVLLHPFHDGNGRTARVIGLLTHDEYDGASFADDYATVTESRDAARSRGGMMIYGYVPHLPEGDQGSASNVTAYLDGLLTQDDAPYVGTFGPAPLN